MFETMKKLAVEEEGADATEYALLAALVAVGIILGATFLGTNINLLFNKIGVKLSAVNP